MTEEEREEKTKEFWETCVWDYVLINQGDDEPVLTHALRIGLFAVTEIFFGDYGTDFGARITHLPTGCCLGDYVDWYVYPAMMVDLAALGAEADTTETAKLQELLAPVGVKHGVLKEPKLRDGLPEKFERIAAAGKP